MPRDGTDRIRTLDPGFWSHPKTLAVMAEDSKAITLLIGIRSKPIDDKGRFRADPLSLKVQILSVDPEATVERIIAMLAILERRRLIHLYEADGAHYGVVHDWLDWQRIDSPHASVMPAPPHCCRCCTPPVVAEPSPTPPGEVADTSPTPRAGCGGDVLGKGVRPCASDTPARAGPAPRRRTRRAPADRLTPEQNAVKQAGVDYLHREVRKFVAPVADPPNWSDAAAAGFFRQRVLAGDDAADFEETVDCYFARLRGQMEQAAERGHPITPGGSFAHFKSTYTSLLREVAAKRDSHAAHVEP